MKKRILSVLLVLVLVVGILPIGVSAAGDGEYDLVRLMKRNEWEAATAARAGVDTSGTFSLQRFFVYDGESNLLNSGAASSLLTPDCYYADTEDVSEDEIQKIIITFTYTDSEFKTKTISAVFDKEDFTITGRGGGAASKHIELTLNERGRGRPEGCQVNFYAELNDETTYTLYDTIYVQHGKKIGNQFPANPPTGSYEFLGWQTEKDGGYTVTADTYITGNMDVYAAKGTAGTGHAQEYHVWAYSNNRDNALLIEVADHYNEEHGTAYTEGSFTMEHIAVNGKDDNSTNPYYSQNNWYPFNEDVYKHYYIYNVEREGLDSGWNHRVEVADITGITVYGKLNGQEYTQFIPRAELNVVEAQSNVVVDIYVREKLDGISKELVTTANQADAPDVEGVTIPEAGEPVYIPEDGFVTLLYKITVTGDYGATYEVKDEDAALVSGYSFTGTIGAEGEAAIYVTKTFDADDIVNDTLSNNASVIPTGSTVGADDDAADDDAVVGAEEGEPEVPVLSNGTPVNLQVYVDGEAATNPLEYVTLGRVSSGSANQFKTSVDADGMVTINYDYETYDCVDIKVDVKDDTAYLLQGVRAYRAYGENGTQNVITNQDGTYTIDNVANYKDHAIIYLYTKYSVKYHQDEAVLTGDDYQDNTVYIIAEGVKAATSIAQYPSKGGYSMVQWKNSGYQTKITLPDLPTVTGTQQITGWYANGTNGTPYKDTSVAVSKVVPENGNTIEFYAVTNMIPAPEAPTVDELNDLIDVYVQCQTAHSVHDWTFKDLLEGSYNITGKGNTRTVTIQAAPYVAALSEKRDVEHENAGNDSATVELIYDGGWKIAQGSSGKVTFQAKCETYVANSYDVIYDHNGKGYYNGQWDTKTDADIPYDSTYTILGNMFAGNDLKGWVLDGWSLTADGSVAFHPGEEVAFNNSTFPGLTEQGRITLYAIWAVDRLGGGKDGNEPDQIPDYKQVFVKYVSADSAMGSVAPSFEKFDVNETIDLTGEATASTGYAFEKWTCEDAIGNPDFPVSDSEKIDYTLKMPTGGTVYTFTAHFKAVAPEAPTDDELADLFKDKISVACVNDQVSHSAKHYGYEANGFSIGAVTEVHGVYTVKATTNASYYLSKYNTDTVTKHALASYQTKTVTVELVWNGSNWTLNDAVTIKVICETPVSPAVPEKPSYSDIASLFRSSIQVDCVSKSYHKTGVYGLLTDGYTVSAPVKGSDGKYTCTVTLLANAYLAKYNDSFGYAKHSLASYQGNESVTLKWNEAEEEWNTVYGQLPVTIDVVCKNYIPVLPSLPDVPDETTPNWLNLSDHDAYIQGYPDGRVKPENNITRAEVATIFFRLLTDEAREYFWSTDSGFSDVKSSDWFNNAVATMVNAGIITGYNDGTFRPNDPITRAEFATIAARFLSDPYSLQDQFYDTEGHWAEVYINRAAEVGWINGYNDGSFRPNKAITRAEAVTLVNNVLGREPHTDYMLDDMITWPDNPKSAWYYEDIQEATNSHDYRWSSGKRYEIWTSLN